MTISRSICSGFFVREIIEGRGDKLFQQPRPPYLAPIIALWVVGLVSSFITPDLPAALGLYKAYIIEPTLFYFVFIHTITDKKQYKAVIWSLGALALWVSLIAILQFFTGMGIPEPYGQEIPRRATSVFPFPNAVSLLITPIFILFAAIFMKIKFFRRKNIWWGLEVLILSGMAILASFSEGAWIAIVFVIGLLALTTPLRWRIISAALLVFLAVILIPPARDYSVRLLTFQDVSGDVRLALWQGTWNLLRDRPVFGAGLGGFPAVYPEYKLDRHVELLQYPHNIFLNWWTELGFAGLIILIWMLVLFFRQGWHALRHEHDDYRSPWPLLAVMTGIIIHGLVDVPYFKNDLAVLFWVWLGLMTIITREHKQEQISS